MKTIVIASNNAHKIKEFKEIFENYNVLSLKDINFFEDIKEDGNTFLENSIIKAKAVTKYLMANNLKASVIADDSGLVVPQLNGEPGIFSARYSGDHNDQKNRDLLLKKLENVADREAYFYCCLVKMEPDGSYIFAEGKTDGKITDTEIGDTSFGYDCIFYSYDLSKTFGEATSAEKNRVSHRGKAVINLLKKINEN